MHRPKSASSSEHAPASPATAPTGASRAALGHPRVFLQIDENGYRRLRLLRPALHAEGGPVRRRMHRCTNVVGGVGRWSPTVTPADPRARSSPPTTAARQRFDRASSRRPAVPCRSASAHRSAGRELDDGDRSTDSRASTRRRSRLAVALAAPLPRRAASNGVYTGTVAEGLISASSTPHVEDPTSDAAARRVARAAPCNRLPSFSHASITGSIATGRARSIRRSAIRAYTYAIERADTGFVECGYCDRRFVA